MSQHCTCAVVIVYMYRYIYCSIISIMQYYAVLVLFHFPPSLLYTAQMHRAFCGALCHKMLCKISSDIIFIITKYFQLIKHFNYSHFQVPFMCNMNYTLFLFPSSRAPFPQ